MPILYDRNRRLFLSQDWAASGFTQRIAGTLSAIALFCGSVLLTVTSLRLRAEILQEAGGLFGEICGNIFAVLAIFVAIFFSFLALRIVRGVVRSFRR